MKGQQFLIVTMSVRAPPAIHVKIITAAIKAGVSYILPNWYGPDISNDKMIEEAYYGRPVKAGIRAIEANGGAAWTALCSNHWYQWSLIMGQQWYGFDLANKKAVFYEDGKTLINTTTWDQSGRAMANLLSLPELPVDENDKSPTVSQWQNKPIYISSFRVSQRDMLDSIHRVWGTTDADWVIEHESSEERWKKCVESIDSGDWKVPVHCMYSRHFFPNGDANIEAKHGLDNEVLGLPKEDLDEATKNALDMFAAGYSPWA